MAAINGSEGAMRIVERDGQWWIGEDENDDRPIWRWLHADRSGAHDDAAVRSAYGPQAREVEIDADRCPICHPTADAGGAAGTDDLVETVAGLERDHAHVYPWSEIKNERLGGPPPRCTLCGHEAPRS